MENKKRLIDAYKLIIAIQRFRWVGVPNTLKLMFQYLRIIINEQPTVDAVEVKHGRWDEIEEEVWHLYKRWPITRFRCSQCKQIENKKSNYCPNCGAKMDLKGE